MLEEKKYSLNIKIGDLNLRQFQKYFQVSIVYVLLQYPLKKI
jgi:hypothetical protein